MPYIQGRDRGRIDDGGTPHTEGQLNYLITSTCLEYLGREPSYSDYNTVIGVLECAKLELYRAQVAPYEDRKRHVNGPVQSRVYNGSRSEPVYTEPVPEPTLTLESMADPALD